MNTMEIVSKRVRQLRELKGLTQDELAKMLGYKNRSSINKIEKGLYEIGQSKILAFAKALDTTPSYLMGWDDEPNPVDDVLMYRKEKDFDTKYENLTPEERELLKLYAQLTSSEKSAAKMVIKGLIEFRENEEKESKDLNKEKKKHA